MMETSTAKAVMKNTSIEVGLDLGCLVAIKRVAAVYDFVNRRLWYHRFQIHLPMR